MSLDGCPSCWPADAAAAWEARRSFAVVNELIDESHFRVTLRACPACGQHFMSVFVEDIDWADGDDPQYWSVMPLRMEESVRLVVLPADQLLRTLGELGTERRCLHRDAPKGADPTIFWRNGLRLE